MATYHLEIKMQLGQTTFLNNWKKYCYLEKGLEQKEIKHRNEADCHC